MRYPYTTDINDIEILNIVFQQTCEEVIKLYCVLTYYFGILLFQSEI